MATLALLPSLLYSQNICPPNAPTEFIVSGRVIAPGETWDQYHEVLQLRETQLVGYGYTRSTGEFELPEQPAGDYYIIVRIDGFKEHREKVNVWSCEKRFPYFVFMEPEPEPIVPVVLDFSGEVKEVVDITELRRTLPKKAVDEFQRAGDDRARGNPAKARERLERIIKDAPDFYDARNVLGTVYLEMKMFREAETQYNIARELRPGSAAPLVSLGSLYVQEADAATNPQPDVVGVIASQSDIRIMLDDARGVLEEAIKLKPDASFAHYLLAVVHHSNGSYGPAETAFRYALELEPRLRWARIGLANTYMRQERWADALAEFDAYLKEFPKVSNRTEVQETRKKVARKIEPAAD